jgi:hypothetical protein
MTVIRFTTIVPSTSTGAGGSQRHRSSVFLLLMSVFQELERLGLKFLADQYQL